VEIYTPSKNTVISVEFVQEFRHQQPAFSIYEKQLTWLIDLETIVLEKHFFSKKIPL
jgi:hypothetical protein